MAHGERTQSRAQQPSVRPQTTDEKKTWGESGRPCSEEALPAENRENGCELGTQRGHLRAPHRGATAHAASLQATAAGEGRNAYVGRERPAGQRGGASGESGERFFDMCKRCGHIRTPRRGAITRAASLQAAGPEREARAMLWGMAQGEITASRNSGRKEVLGRERPAGQRSVAGGEPGECLANWARKAVIFGRHGATQQRAPHLCKPPPRVKLQSRCGVRTAGQATRRCRRRIGRTVWKLGKQRGHLRTPRRGATARPHICKQPVHSETREQRDVTWHAARSQRRRRDHGRAA